MRLFPLKKKKLQALLRPKISDPVAFSIRLVFSGIPFEACLS